jgi:hypothetical protein
MSLPLFFQREDNSERSNSLALPIEKWDDLPLSGSAQCKEIAMLHCSARLGWVV